MDLWQPIARQHFKPGTADLAGCAEPRSEAEALRDELVRTAEERDRYREALRMACADAWSDGDAAAGKYLRRADAALARSRHPEETP